MLSIHISIKQLTVGIKNCNLRRLLCKNIDNCLCSISIKLNVVLVGGAVAENRIILFFKYQIKMFQRNIKKDFLSKIISSWRDPTIQIKFLKSEDRLNYMIRKSKRCIPTENTKIIEASKFPVFNWNWFSVWFLNKFLIKY